jgi:hypothetical protein
MHGLLKQPGYRLYSPASPEARALLAKQGLGPADLDRALACLERTEGTALRTIVGINEDGVFRTSRAGWRPDLPDACREPFIPLLWVKVHELLGRVPRAAPHDSSRTARCRARPKAAPPSTGWPAEGGGDEAHPD